MIIPGPVSEQVGSALDFAPIPGPINPVAGLTMKVVQSGETTLTGGGRTETITITEIDDVDTHFVLLNGSALQLAGYAAETIGAYVSSTTAITIQQASDSDTLHNIPIHWQLVQCEGLAGAIRQGVAAYSINLTASHTWQDDLDNITISDLGADGAVYTASPMPNALNGGYCSATGGGDIIYGTRQALTSDTNIAIDARGNSAGGANTGDFAYLVIPCRA
jgi:hypothetical protein